MSDPLAQFRTQGKESTTIQHGTDKRPYEAYDKKGEPVIESIRFIAGDKLEDILSTHRGGK